MLTFLPALLLFITALAIFFLRYLPKGTGYAWLTGGFMILLIWGGVLAYHWVEPAPVEIVPWRPFEPQTADAIRFKWDSISWLYSFTVVSICLGVLLSSGARFKLMSNPLSWAANLLVASAGVVAILANSPLAVVLAWVPLDILDLVLVTRLSRSWKHSIRGVIVFAFRCLSIFLLLGALVVQRFIGIPLEFGAMSPLASLFVLLSLGLRLSLLPLNLPYISDLPFQHGLISNLRVTAHLVALAALARISKSSIPGHWLPALYTLAVLGCLYGAIMWVTSRDEISGRPYWLVTLGGLAFISVLQGHPEQSTTWGLVMGISGMALFLFTARSRKLVFIPLLGLIALTGLPFTPASNGWGALILLPFNLGDAALIFSVALLLVGYIKHALKPAGNYSELDGWVKGFYPVGLILMLASGWIAASLGLSGGLVSSTWQASAAALIVAGVIILAGWQVRRLAALPFSPGLTRAVKSGWGWLFQFLQFNWLYELLWAVYRGLRRLVAFLTLLFEGEGGLLWSFLLLALMLTILATKAGS